MGSWALSAPPVEKVLGTAGQKQLQDVFERAKPSQALPSSLIGGEARQTGAVAKPGPGSPGGLGGPEEEMLQQASDTANQLFKSAPTQPRAQREVGSRSGAAERQMRQAERGCGRTVGLDHRRLPDELSRLAVDVRRVEV